MTLSRIQSARIKDNMYRGMKCLAVVEVRLWVDHSCYFSQSLVAEESPLTAFGFLVISTIRF